MFIPLLKKFGFGARNPRVKAHRGMFELDSCPFCGGHAVTCHNTDADTWFVQCEKCLVSTSPSKEEHGFGRALAVKTWNTRKKPKTISGKHDHSYDDLDY
jgi:hypothetical protein